MSNINTVVIGGNIVADCEKSKAGDTPCINFTVASNEWRKNAKTGDYEGYPNYVDCTMFGKRAQGLSNYITKGAHVTVFGHLRQSRWEKDGQKRSKLTVIAEEVELFIPKDDKGEQKEIPW